jgi:uncharacterized OB-fold protein
MSSLPAQRIVGGINADQEYWEHLGAGEFRLPHCAGCQRTIWPAHFRCGECGSWDMEWVEHEPAGVVFSWTRTWYPFDRTTERADDIPYVTVLCEVDGADGARVMGMLDGADDGLKVGARVRGVIKPPSVKSKHYPSICWVLDRSRGQTRT